MPYVIAITLIDLGGYYITGFPPITGSIFAPPPPSGSPGTPLATAATTAAAPLTLTFPSAAVPPAVVSAVLVNDPSGPGDLFRSGPVGTLPPSPGPLIVFTTPTASIPGPALTAAAAGFAPLGVPISAGAAALVGVLTGGTVVPISLTITGVGLTVTPPTLTLVVTGTFIARQFIFWTIVHAFTLTFTLTPAPSGDATDRSRILSMTPAGATMVTTGIPNFVSGVLAPIVAGMAASRIESGVNGLLASTLTSVLSSLGLVASPTSAICARRATLPPTTGAGGMILQLTLSDLLGPGFLPILKNLAVTITPTPVAGVLKNYVITVTDAAMATPVSGATVKIHNATAQGAAAPVSAITGSNGQTPPIPVTLHNPFVIVTGQKDGPLKDKEDLPLTMTVTAAGYNSLTVTIL